METLYTKITNAQQFARTAGAMHQIPDATAIYLTLAVIEKSGAFNEPCSNWRKRPEADQTMANFHADMDHTWKEHNRHMKSSDAGYHQALVANANNTTRTPDVLVDTVPMYYCWSHGLGFNEKHDSKTCNNKKEGHQETATIKNRMGGSTSICVGNRGPRRTTES
jgi:hypothetical protein